MTRVGREPADSRSARIGPPVARWSRSEPIRPLGVGARNEPRIERCPARDRYAVPLGPGALLRDSPPAAAAPGSVFSLGDLLEDQFVDSEIRDSSLQPGVLRFQFFQPPGLVGFHPAVAFAPATVRLVANTDLLAGLADGFPLAQQDVGSPKLLNDLFGAVSFPRHGSSPQLAFYHFRSGPDISG